MAASKKSENQDSSEKGSEKKEFEKVDPQAYAPAPIAGVDEVGRGCLAGPVYAAAVVLKSNQYIEELTDSKLLSEKRREE